MLTDDQWNKSVSLGKDGVWWTVQGEGHLSGKGMTFVRFAGCSVGCAKCDTDYAVAERNTVAGLVADVITFTPKTVTDRWVWLTGGEPADQPALNEVVRGLQEYGFSVAVASSGTKRVVAPVHWLSVSPHSPNLVQLYGNEVKVVPGLNGYGIEELCNAADQGDWWERFVMPLWDEARGAEDPESVKECVDWVKHNPRWGITRQSHKWLGFK